MKEELHEIINNVEILYKYKDRKYDNKHLIFVFSGFLANRDLDYDFENVLEHCPARIIWLKDLFRQDYSYYLCQNMDFSYSDALSKFIENKILEFGMSRQDVTFTGFSKGGSAALYFGIKHNIKNIVVTVPQINIGNYIINHHPRVAKHILGDVQNKENIDKLNNIILQAIEQDKNNDRNIYLLSSKADEQYPTEILPNLEKLGKYKNFNLLMSNSLLVTEHKDVTPYHVPLLLGIYYSLAQGAIPKYGNIELEGDLKIRKVSENPELVALLKKFRFENHLFFPQGLGYIKGIRCAKWSDINIWLNISNDSSSISIKLAKDHKSKLTRELYDNGAMNYSKAWFCTNRYKGIDLESIDIPKGKYMCRLYIETPSHSGKKDLLVNEVYKNQLLCENDFYKLYTLGRRVYFEKK